MAALVGHHDFWNKTSKETLNILWLRVDNIETISVIFIILGIVRAPLIVFGNSFVIWSVWKDPLKKLRRSPSGLVLLLIVAQLVLATKLYPEASGSNLLEG